MNGVKITKLELVNTITPKPGANMSLIADVSVKNPNVASFRYSNTTTSLYYRGVMVGEARGPPGRAKARRTIRMNVTVDVITDRIISIPDFGTDLGSGLLTMCSFSRVPGQVKILNLFKRHVVVKMNCSTTFNISTRAIKEQSCQRKVKL
ncbi:Late embryogenesis abundant protein [Spatholobus suberectus]|nr:Late embryogenesis abundant protein [Spatholobus suberectus]